LAKSLIIEARVVQSGDTEVRLVQCVAPGPNPLFPVVIVMSITRDGRWRKSEDRKGQHSRDDRLRRTPSPNTHGLSLFEKDGVEIRTLWFDIGAVLGSSAKSRQELHH
jgi:hypothetical protein